MNEPLVKGAAKILGVLKEPANEKRVSLTVDTVKQLVADGYQVVVESGAGVSASQEDSHYSDVGCTIASRDKVVQDSDVLFRINPPEDFQGMSHKIVISWVGSRLAENKPVVAAAKAADVTLMDLTMVPRITIGQKLDVLSSQAKVAGHRAVVEAAHAFGRFHQSEMTAAGKYPPSTTLILGCGVAGLAAIATSKALGSQVRAWDVREVAREQVESMGGKWVSVNFKEDASGAGGYAKESSQEFQDAQKATFKKELQNANIAITTAAIPGCKAPLLITEDMVKAMKPGSVIVDLAALTGGNCDCTVKDEICVRHGVTIIGYTDLPARMALQSSSMYGQNMVNLVRHVQADTKGEFVDRLYKELEKPEGEIIAKSVVVCYAGKDNVAPRPPANLGIASKKDKVDKAPPPAPNPCRDAIEGTFIVIIVCLLMMGIGVSGNIGVLRSFLLAGAAGYQAVWGVAHALHSPLMAVTNAISGLTVLGGIEVFNALITESSTGGVDDEDGWVSLVLCAIATTVSSVNVTGGFLVTQRVLSQFKRKDKSGIVKKEDEDWTPFYLLLIPFFLAWCLLDPKQNIDVAESLCAVFCIFAIACLATHRTANLGCKFGIVGVVTAIGTALIRVAHPEIEAVAATGNLTEVPCASTGLGFSCGAGWGTDVVLILAVCIVMGSALGVVIGVLVDAERLPQTVAGFHSLVGLAAMVTSVAAYYKDNGANADGANIKNISALLGNFIGGVTLTGSIIAFAKLNENLSSKALSLPGKNFLNLGGFATFGALCALLCKYGAQETDYGQVGVIVHWMVVVLSLLMGMHLVWSVGGGDMPVCVTVLNSYSGWALAAEGFNMQKPLLACVGAIIGFSGAILTKIMCDAMNRDILNVIFGGMNVAPPAKVGDQVVPEHREATSAQVAEMLRGAKKVAIVPGYGMALARAQQQVGALATALRENDVEAIFVIHPVAGRMPGQMNVLLAEADVDHTWVKEMDEVNEQMKDMDVTFCIGSNDIVNSAAQDDPTCPIAGMPVIEVWKSKQVVFMKRSLKPGYADMSNPVFYKDNTVMYLGSADKKTEELLRDYQSAV